ncbi:MAG TPA: choice-of-anchor Q domain-containing protein, partial [Bryobacteraceae bacterium]|nr:choice-of-anchor Q domain-containing protein [Bryobacteraceae bacterium]
SHDARLGHLLKSRATVTNILYDFIYDGANANSSYELDFPNAGTVNIVGSVVAQGPHSPNRNIIAFGEEGPGNNTSQRLNMVNNTIVNRQRSGTFVDIASWIATPARIMNNIFAGVGTVITQKSAVMTTNLSGEDPQFVNSPTGDFRLRPNSPAIHNGTGPIETLMPLWSSYKRTCGIARPILGQIDIGAYGYGAAGGQVVCSAAAAVMSDLSQ